MKIIYRGGYTKKNKESYKYCSWFTYEQYLQRVLETGLRVAIVPLAKGNDNHYDEEIEKCKLGNADIITLDKRDVEWSDYDVIFIPGGDPLLLYNRLIERKFSLDILKKDSVIIGDSAGAMILAKEFMEVRNWKNFKISFYKGFNPSVNFVILPHVDNSFYGNFLFRLLVKIRALFRGMKIISLKENEEFKLII